MSQNKDIMHPQDLRNLFIFAILSICLWSFYDVYILKPKAQALRQEQKARAALILKNPNILDMDFIPRSEALAAASRIFFSNGEVEGSISLRGGQIDDLKLSQYFETLEKKDKIVLLSPNKTEKARYFDLGWVGTDRDFEMPDAQTIWNVRGNVNLSPDHPVVLFWQNPQGLVFERKISIDKDFAFTITQSVTNNSGRPVTLHPFALISQTGIPKDNHNTWTMHEGPISYIDGALVQKGFPSMETGGDETIRGNTGWIGVSDKYWLTALMPEQNRETTFRYAFTGNPLNKEKNRYQMDFTGPAYNIPPEGSVENKLHFYAGAKKVLLLEKYEKELGVRNIDLAVDFGWFWFFTYPFFFALHYLGLAVGNMGVAIVILTILVRAAVFPLTNFSYKSFAKMKVVAPRITELREQYKDNKQKLQEEIIALYQKEGVNPMSGCLPILIQIPIFFAFYKTIFVTIEVRHAPFFGWIKDLSTPDPTSIFNLFGMLPYQVPPVLMIGVWPCLMCMAMMMQRNLNPPPQDKTQQIMMKIFPFLMTFIMAGFASALVIYWTVSAFIGVLQQTIIMRSMGVPVYFFNKDHYAQEAEAQLAKGPDVHPLIGMAEQEAEKGLFGAGENDTPPDITPPKPKKKKKKK